MKTVLLLVVVLMAGAAVVGCERIQGKVQESPAVLTPQTEDQKTLYTIGLMLGQSISALNFSASEIEYIKIGVADQLLKNQPIVSVEAYATKVDALTRARQVAVTDADRARAQTALQKAAQEEDAVRLPSGVVIRTLQAGQGPTPRASDVVKVHYVGKLADGTEFDNSLKANSPALFPVDSVIACWTEGLQRMVVGERAKLTCPAETAYGVAGHPPAIPGSATLIFDIQMLALFPAEEPVQVADTRDNPPRHHRRASH